MRKKEYDFLTWTSFPSSIKLTNDERREWAWTGWVFYGLPVRPGSKLTVKFKAKQQNVLYSVSHVPIDGYNGSEWRRIVNFGLSLGTFDWTEHSRTITVPSDIISIRSSLAGGAGSPEALGITWYDDLRVYMDDKLIFSYDFGNWNPIIGAGAGIVGIGVPAYLYTKNIPVAIGAGVVASLVGAAIGYFISPL